MTSCLTSPSTAGVLDLFPPILPTLPAPVAMSPWSKAARVLEPTFGTRWKSCSGDSRISFQIKERGG